jgi:hypothetical protein
LGNPEVEEFKVPLRKVSARAVMLDGQPVDGQFHVPARSPGGGPGRLIDRLNDDDGFLPWSHAEGTDLVNKSSIVWIQVGPGEPAEEPGSEDREHAARVTVTLRGGVTFEGELHYLMPHGRSRVLDFLNAAPHFVAVRDGEGIRLLNLAYVMRLRQHR